MSRKFRTKEWAIMMFIANDNNLGEFTATKIDEIASVGSTRAADVIIQFDTPGPSAIRRMRLSKGRRFPLRKRQAETNTGDKRTLIRFADLTLDDFHPRRSMLTIYNHGTGFGIADDKTVRPIDAPAAVEPARRCPGHRRRPPIFWSATNRETALAVLDVSDAEPVPGNDDALDLLELKAAMQTIVRKHGRVELLAFDACLMGTFEGAYQLRNHAHIMVASQSNIPGPGCRFASTFALMRDESLSTATIAKALADDVTPVTEDEYSAMAVLDLEQADELAEAISVLADVLIQAMQTDQDALSNINLAHLSALHFLDSETIDLFDFCERLTKTMSENERVVEAATEVQEAIEELVLHNNPRGAVVEGARGISITLPRRNQLSDLYRQLDFPRETSWIDFLNMYLEKQYPPIAEEPELLVAPVPPPPPPPVVDEVLEPAIF